MQASVSLKPPQYNANLVMKRTWRFVYNDTTGITKSISNLNMLMLANVCTSASTTCSSIYRAFRIHRIRVWQMPLANGSVNTCAVSFYNSNGQGAAVEVSDTSMNVSQPCYVDVVPPQGSFASFWQDASGTLSTTLFNISLSGYAVIDIHCTHVVRDSTSGATTASQATVMGTVGLIGYSPLDGASGVLFPASLTNSG